MILVDERLWRDALLSSPDSDGHTMLIGASHIDDILPLKPQVANISVGRQVRPRYMPDMQRAVGIGERGCDRISLKLLHGFKNLFRPAGRCKDDNCNDSKKILDSYFSPHSGST